MSSIRKVLKDANAITKTFKNEVKDIEKTNENQPVMTAMMRIIVTEMNKLPIDQLEQIRYNINTIINKKKLYKSKLK